MKLFVLIVQFSVSYLFEMTIVSIFGEGASRFGKNTKLQIHHLSMHNAVAIFEKHFQISTLAPEIFSLLPICLTADSTAPEPIAPGCNF
jgi:hypothetical protein